MELKKLLYSAVFVTTALFTNTALAQDIILQSEDIDELNGEGNIADNTAQNIDNIKEGTWVRYADVNLTGIVSFSANVAQNQTSEKTITMFLGEGGGVPSLMIAEIKYSNKNGWQSYEETDIVDFPGEISGVHDVYFVFTGGSLNTDFFTLYDDIDDIKPAAVGDTFTEGDYDFKVTSIDPLEAEVSGSTLANVVVPTTATDAVKNATYTITAVGASAFLGDVVPEADDAAPGININSTLVSVVLPASVKTIKSDAFTRCQNLENINLENIVTIEAQNAFFDCPKLTVASLDSATDIGNFAFHGLNNSTLTSISIPKAVNISKSAFRTSQITSIDIPVSVLTIGSQVFMACTALTEVKVNWTTAEAIPAIDVTETTTEINPDTNEEETKIGTATFQDVDIANVTLVVPEGTAEFYRAVAGWQDFEIKEDVLSTDTVARELGFNVVSNVVENTISIENNNLKQATITIVNVSGSVLLTTTANNLQNSIDVSGLSSGIYLMKVSTDEYTFVERIIKQ